MRFLLLVILLSSCGLKQVKRTVPPKKEILCKDKMTAKDYKYLLYKLKRDENFVEAIKCARLRGDDNFYKLYMRKVSVNNLSKKSKLTYYKILAEFYLKSGRYDQYARLRKNLLKYNVDNFVEAELFYHLKFTKLDEAGGLLNRIKKVDVNKYYLYYSWYAYLKSNKEEALRSLIKYNNKKDKNFLILYAAMSGKKLNLQKLENINFMQSQFIERHNARN